MHVDSLNLDLSADRLGVAAPRWDPDGTVVVHIRDAYASVTRATLALTSEQAERLAHDLLAVALQRQARHVAAGEVVTP